MRGIAAIAVMLCHYTENTLTPLFGFAPLAVDLFFCLSGFVLAYSYRHRLGHDLSLSAFFIKRLIRLSPLFLTGFSLGAVAIGIKIYFGQSSMSYQEMASASVLNLFYLPYISLYSLKIGFHDVGGALFPGNNPLWSLSFELAVNVVFGFWVLRLNNKWLLPVILMSGIWLIAYCVLSQTVAPGWRDSTIIGGIPRTFYGFFFGVYIFILRDKIRFYLPRVDPLYILGAFLIIFSMPTFLHWGKLWLLMATVLVPLAVGMALNSDSSNSVFRKILDCLGWISYPLYCVHFPIYMIYTALKKNVDLGLEGAVICTPIALLLAVFAAKFVDEPMRKKITA